MSFASKVAALSKVYKDRLAFVCDEVTRSLANEFIQRTPIDTGFMVSNWDVGVGFKPTVVYGTYDRNRFINGAEMIAVTRVASLVKDTLGKIVWVANSVHYAQYIENHHSRENAPEGIIRITVRGYGEHVAAAVLKSRFGR